MVRPTATIPMLMPIYLIINRTSPAFLGSMTYRIGLNCLWFVRARVVVPCVGQAVDGLKIYLYSVPLHGVPVREDVEGTTTVVHVPIRCLSRSLNRLEHE